MPVNMAYVPKTLNPGRKVLLKCDPRPETAVSTHSNFQKIESKALSEVLIVLRSGCF